MNPSFEQISTVDAAKMLGVNRTSVANWCRAGIINFIDVSEPDSNIPRYVVSEDEVEKIKKAIKRYGKSKWLKHYKKIKKPIKNANNLDEIKPIECGGDIVQARKVPVIVRDEEEKTIKKDDTFDTEKITNTILYIKQVKERLEDLEAEKNQLLNELEELRKEVLDYI